MSSFVETTAVSLRSGTTPENLSFTGASGEVVADMGYSTETGLVVGTDKNATLRLHNGITQGGIPLARADTLNLTTVALAENRHFINDKNLAYANLSNIEISVDPVEIEKILNTLTSYGLATTTEIENDLVGYALKDMRNVNTTDLAEGRGEGIGGNLAYADTSNINTLSLTNSILHDGANGNYPLAYANAANIDTHNLTLDASDSTRPTSLIGPGLATIDFSNVTIETWGKITADLNLETTSNKDYVIPDDVNAIIDGHYPETIAVKNYIDSQFNAEGAFLKTDLTNISSYDTLTSTAIANYVYSPDDWSITEVGDGYELNQSYLASPLIEINNISTITLKLHSLETNTSTTVFDRIEITPKFTKTVNTLPSPATFFIVDEDDQIISSVEVYHTSVASEDGSYYINEVDKVNTIFTTPLPVDPFGNAELETDYTSNIIGLFDINIGGITADGGIDSFSFNFTNSEEPVFGELTIINDNSTVESKITGFSKNTLPAIGGGNLLKVDFSNLKGMSQTDIAANENATFKINQTRIIPSLVSNEEDDNYIVLEKQVRDFVKTSIEAIPPSEGGGNNLTDCPTKSLVDYKFEYTDSVVVLKEGSTVYRADGTKETLLVSATSENSTSGYSLATDGIYLLESDGEGLHILPTTLCTSSNIDPLESDYPTYVFWFNHTTNKWFNHIGAEWAEVPHTIPQAQVTVRNGKISEVVTLNTISYFGKSIWNMSAEYLIPNGFNDDGTYSNITIKNNVPTILPSENVTGVDLSFNTLRFLGDSYTRVQKGDCYISTTPPSFTGRTTVWFNPSTNFTYRNNTEGNGWLVLNESLVCNLNVSGGIISKIYNVNGIDKPYHSIENILNGTYNPILQRGVNQCTVSTNSTIVLPTPILGQYNQVKLILNMPYVVTINLGTDVFFNETAPDLSVAGNYHLYWDFDEHLGKWICGGMKVG